MKERIKLPDGREATMPTVNPKNWDKPDADLSKPWFIHWRTYTPGSKKPQDGRLRGMNDHMTLKGRQEATKALLKHAINELKNPQVFQAQLFDNLSPETSMDVALTKTYQKMKSEDDNIKSVCKGFITGATRLLMQKKPISEIRRKHVKAILENIRENNSKFTNNTYNHYLRYLRMVFAELVEMEVVESNPITDLRKLKITKKQVIVLSKPEFEKVEEFLNRNYPTFANFVRIFFTSGGRVKELLSVKVKDVDLNTQEYTCLVKKRKTAVWVTRAISDYSLESWRKAVKGGMPDDYVFSENLCPGPRIIRREQVTRRWEEHVKGKLKVKADLYKLKHLYTSLIVDQLSLAEAARQNAHTSSEMVKRVYDVKGGQRELARLKSIKDPFAHEK